MYKVVYNAGYGGYGVSLKGVQWMADRGNEKAIKELKRISESDSWKYGCCLDLDRHDPLLVEMAETLGEEANGDCATLKVAELDQEFYQIEEYDGWETIHEPNTMNWISAKIK